MQFGGNDGVRWSQYLQITSYVEQKVNKTNVNFVTKEVVNKVGEQKSEKRKTGIMQS